MIGRLKEVFGRKLFEPIARSFSSFMGPNSASVLGFLLALASSYFYFNWEVFPYLVVAPLLLLASGFFDALDGAIARVSGKVTKFGGLLDSVLDRLSEIAVYTSLVVSGACNALLGILALSFSLMVSYCRARSESLGVQQLGVGLAERPERILLLVGFSLAAAFAGMWLLDFGVSLIASLSLVTVFQRIYWAKKQMG